MKMATDQFVLGLLLLLVGFLLLRFLARKTANKPSRGSYKGPAIYPVVGSAFEFYQNRHRFLQWFAEIHDNMPTNTFKLMRPGGIRDIMTANPANVEHILKTNFDSYPKGERFRDNLHDLLGRGIFNADGELWKMQRKTASYEFNTKSLRSFVVEMQSEIQNRLMPVLSNACQTGECIDLQDVLQRFAFDNICRVAFGVDPSCLHPSMPTSPFAKAFDDATDISAGRFFSTVPFLWRVKRLLDVGSERRLREAISVVDEFALDVVRSRRKEISENGGRHEKEDLLSRFIAALSNNSNIEAQDYLDLKSGATMDLFLKDMVVSFMLAGRDTTSAALTWFFWLLSSHPQVEKAIETEILQVLANRKAEATDNEQVVVLSFEEMKDMQYLHAALCESMRLYPPVPVDTKLACKDDVLPDGTPVEKGCYLTYSNYSMGRMKTIWDSDCLEFKPERWLNNGEFRGENPYKFPIFHAGPRICLGKDMAFIQMKSIVASVIHRFSLKAEDKNNNKKCPDYVVSLTMRMEGGLPVRVKGK